MAIHKEEALPTSEKGAVQRSRPAEFIDITSNPYVLINNQYF